MGIQDVFWGVLGGPGCQLGALTGVQEGLGRLWCALGMLIGGAKEDFGGQARRKRSLARSVDIPKLGSRGSQMGRTGIVGEGNASESSSDA